MLATISHFQLGQTLSYSLALCQISRGIKNTTTRLLLPGLRLILYSLVFRVLPSPSRAGEEIKDSFREN